MNKIKINRKASVIGKACKMICYINGMEICRLEENESYVYETEIMKCEFTCQLTFGNPMSEKYRIDFRKGEMVNIDAVQGSWKPKVAISYIKEMPINMVNEIKSIEGIREFSPTKKIGKYLYIDEDKKQWAIPKGIFGNKIKEIYSYSDILSYELLEDGNTITKGGLGRALVGGILFGGVGAIVGGVTGRT